MKSHFFLFLFLVVSLSASAIIKVSSILGDNMVLQRNAEIKIWGKASPGQKLTIAASWNNAIQSTNADTKGNWLFNIKTTEAGGPYTILISSGSEKTGFRNVMLGDVWLCAGQSNMEMPISGFGDSPVNGSFELLMDADNNYIRLFSVKNRVSATPLDSCTGKWLPADAENVAKFSAVAYLFARKLQQKLKVPVGVICASWGGSRIESWMAQEFVSGFADAYKQTTQEKTSQHHWACNIYNGMISPLTNYCIKGVIWYQGESNIVNYYDYASLQSALVKNWRNVFGVGDFPFYFVQIAPFQYKGSKLFESALQREQQQKAMVLIPNSGMVCTLDLGEENNIHPAAKTEIATRLAALAFSDCYGFKGIPYKSPVFKNMIVKDSLALISFENAEKGLTFYGKSVDCFQIAGNDSVFYPATTSITQRQVKIFSPKVKVPVAVRYAFCNFPKTTGFLYSTDGLPVLPFRTDNWKLK